MKESVKKYAAFLRNKETSVVMLFIIMALMAVVPRELFAVTTPASGSFAYDLYDIAVLKILQGPIGFVGGCGAIVYGAMCAMQHPLTAITPILGGAALLKADAIVNTLGMMLY